MQTNMRILLLDGSVDGETLFTAEDVKCLPREFERIRFLNRSGSGFVVIEQGVWHVFDVNLDKVTVVVEDYDTWIQRGGAGGG